MYFFPFDTWSLLLPSFIIIPQIVHNALQGNRVKIRPEYIFGYLGLRLLLPLYYNGC
jgi:hypothetical protein